MSKTVTLEEIQGFKGKYPKQLWFLFASEMWERFCFYGMRGVLTIFMIEKLLIPDDEANLKYGAIQAFVYTMTFVGGFFADKILGFRKSILWGALLMIAGSFTIAFAPEDLFYIGTSISIVGTGFFKPNISGIVGMLYKDKDIRRDAGFALFYSGINIGALLGGYLCFYLGNNFGWEWSFISAGIAMILGLLIFGLNMKQLGPLGFSPLLKKENMTKSKAMIIQLSVYIGSLISIPAILMLVQNSDYTNTFMLIVGPAALLYFLIEAVRCTPQEMKKLFAALIFILFSVFFWAFFEQSGGSLAIVARKHVTHEIAGISMNPNELNNSANALFVILLSPLFGLLWMWLAKRKKTIVKMIKAENGEMQEVKIEKTLEPNTVVKFGLGFIFLAVSFFVFHTMIQGAAEDGISSLTIFAFAYLIMTVGELCLSPIGLSAMTKLAPKKLIGIIMGLWFLASAYGQYIAGLLGAGMAQVGGYKIEMTSTERADNPNMVTITWKDTTGKAADFDKMTLYFSTPKADTLKSDWIKSGFESTEIQTGKNNEALNWRYTGIENKGEISVEIPAELLANKEATLSIEPVPFERLKLYTTGYKQLALYALICGLVLIVISPLVRKLMGDIK